MNRYETATLLGMAAAYDQRTVGEADVVAWHAILDGTPFDLAKQAVIDHYRGTRDRLMPADVVNAVAAIRKRAADEERNEQVRRELLAAPRPPAERVQRGIAHVSDALSVARGLHPQKAAVDGQRRKAVLAVPCTYCRAQIGRACVSLASGEPLTRVSGHPSRVVLAARRARGGNNDEEQR